MSQNPESVLFVRRALQISRPDELWSMLAGHAAAPKEDNIPIQHLQPPHKNNPHQEVYLIDHRHLSMESQNNTPVISAAKAEEPASASLFELTLVQVEQKRLEFGVNSLPEEKKNLWLMLLNKRWGPVPLDAGDHLHSRTGARKRC